MAIHLNILLLLSGALQGILLSVVLLSRKTFRSAYIFLVGYLFVLILQILFKVADKVWLMEHLYPGYTLSYYFTFLYGPFIWLFAKSMLSKEQFSIKQMTHFIPFVYAVIVEGITQYDHSLLWLEIPVFGFTGTAMQIISLSLYHWFAYKVSKGFKMGWFRDMVIFSFISGTVISLLLLFIYYTFPVYAHLRYGFILLTVFLYWISYKAWKQPLLYSTVVDKYATSTLSEREAARIEAELASLMELKKPYTEPQLNIDGLALQLNTTRHSLSQVLNQRLQQSFYDYVNSFRIEEAKRLLKCPAHDNNKISSIAFDAGFNSLSAFNDVFKKRTGITPSAYRKMPVEHHFNNNAVPNLSVR